MPMFYIIGITSFIFLVLLYLLMPNDDPIQEHALRKKEEEEKKGNQGHQTRNQQLRSLLTNWGFLFVLAISMIVGYGNTNLSALRAYYSETKLLNKENEPKQLTSLLSLFGVIFEILSFFFAKRLLQFVGKYNMLTIALFMMICRCWSYYLVPEGSKSWFFFILAIECFCRGIQVGTLYSASVQIASEVAGPDLQATAQGIVSSVNYGLSGVVGSLGASLVLKVTDNHFKSVFLVAGILTSCSLVCVGGFNYWRYKSAKKSEVEVVDVEKVEK